MKENGPAARKPPSRPSPALRRWLIRIAVAAAVLSLIGFFSTPTVSPLLCKIYG